jgi:hypothetical protein
MKTITTSELLRLAQIQDPESELYKMSYADISAIKDGIEKVINQTKDDRVFSILMRLKSHVMICEDWIRYHEVRKIERFSSLDYIASYVKELEKQGRVTIFV